MDLCMDLELAKIPGIIDPNLDKGEYGVIKPSQWKLTETC
jgi:hypothetical protein